MENNEFSPQRLNLHHLYYFWAVAKDGTLTHAAKTLRISPSALSAQIRQLEGDLGVELFERVGRSLQLTEAGNLTLSFAEDIFAKSQELQTTLRVGVRERQILRIGAVATLSRNFQDLFLRPVASREGASFRLVSGRVDDLLDQLKRHEIDLLLANHAPPRLRTMGLRTRRLARQPVSIVGPSAGITWNFPKDIDAVPLLVPGPDSAIRREFDAICEQAEVRVRIFGEVDDMAMLRLLARDYHVPALLPSVVVRDELRTRQLHEYCLVPGLFESFYAITDSRKFQHPLLGHLLKRAEAELLADAEEEPGH